MSEFICNCQFNDWDGVSHMMSLALILSESFRLMSIYIQVWSVCIYGLIYLSFCHAKATLQHCICKEACGGQSTTPNSMDVFKFLIIRDWKYAISVCDDIIALDKVLSRSPEVKAHPKRKLKMATRFSRFQVCIAKRLCYSCILYLIRQCFESVAFA